MFKDLLLDSPRVAHRLDMFIKHHTNIHAIIHEANNRSKLEQYTNEKEFEIKSTRCYDHTDATSTLIGAMVKKIHLPIDLFYTWKRKL